MPQKHYTGGCQCGAVTFEVDADLDQTMTCNCSRCQRMGFVLSFVPRDAFHLVKDGPLTEYRFNKEEIQHLFCPVCGVEPFAYGEQGGQKMVAINVNCLADVDPRALPSQHVDGASY